MKTQNQKTVMMALSLIVITLLTSGFVSAEFWMCFSRGQTINFCNPQIPDRTASTDTYRMCMKTYDEANNCYGLGSWNVCNALAGAGCGGNGEGGEIDSNAPVITVNTPVENFIYNSRKVNLGVAINEQGKIEYEDLINGRGRCSILCKGCSATTKALSFKEGENRYRIKATDYNGNEAFKDIIFFVDSQKPRIHNTQPKSGFANGNFAVQYTEDNLKGISLNYGNPEHGYQEAALDLNNCPSGKKQSCDVNVDLGNYSEDVIEYFFSVEDIAGTTTVSKTLTLDVDSTFPKINSFNYQITGTKVYFTIAVDEKNLDEVSYIDNFGITQKEKRMCSRLTTDGLCKYSTTFTSGQHSLAISVLDEAGNMISQNVEFTI
jgi:hypothetical protein